jgi:hypothetical protein
VTTKDHNNNVLHVGGNDVKATFDGRRERWQVDVKPTTRTARTTRSYVPKKVGAYKLGCDAGRAPTLRSSPFDVTVIPAAPNAANTEAHGDGIKTGRHRHAGQVQDSDEGRVWQQLRRGRRRHQGRRWRADRTTRRSPAMVKDNNDGTYDVEYQPKGSGQFKLDVTLGGAHIKDAPFKRAREARQGGGRQHGRRAATASRRWSPARLASSTVQTKDHNGNLCDFGGNKVAGAAHGPRVGQRRRGRTTRTASTRRRMCRR